MCIRDRILSAVLSPFQKGASAVSGGVGGLLDKYARIDSIIAENEALKEENWELQEDVYKRQVHVGAGLDHRDGGAAALLGQDLLDGAHPDIRRELAAKAGGDDLVAHLGQRIAGEVLQHARCV